MFLAIRPAARLVAVMKLTKGRPAAGWVRWVLAAMALLAAACGLPRPGLAIDVFDIAKAAPQQDLTVFSVHRVVSVEDRRVFTLIIKSPLGYRQPRWP